MASSIQFPFNDLPKELQDEIFILAAGHHRGDAVRLALVAQQFYQCVNPRLYNLVTLGDTATDLFLRTVQSRSDAGIFFRDKVKKLCLTISVSPASAEQILSFCTGVNDLALWIDYLSNFPNRTITPLITNLPLRRLSLEYNHFISLFREPHVQHAWLNTLTHLYVIFWHFEPSPVIPHLQSLDALTHLALRLGHNKTSQESLIGILEAGRRLKILIIYAHPDQAEGVVWPTDRRVVFLPSSGEAVQRWEAQAWNDEDCDWIRAAELSDRKASEQGSSSA